ncbi:hypothetical protein FKW77_004346 [Venturia effusa]|uniref:PXA domain-containing protein n=1 Tax=Venturia effusa TaxID=50376 RepID=A0A517LR56_9PEZI|nr:hypothetical protein FKW77_004346 [Venturia effusa]
MEPRSTEQPSNKSDAESGASVDIPLPPSSVEVVEEHPRTIPEETPQSFQTTAQNLTDQALQFLSTASNETLGACLVGIGATTYFVLGRAGLVLIGVVGGVVLHATWEGGTSEGNVERNIEERRRKELGVEVARRALEWRRVKGNKEANEEEKEEKVAVVGKKLGFEGFRPETEAALNELTEAVIRDYVKWWYSPVIPGEETFPAASRQTLVAFLLSVSSHLSRKRPADTFLEFLTNSSSIMIVFLGELSAAISASPSTAAAEAIETYLEMKPESNLASILDPKHQAKKLDLVAEDILECYLEPKSYNAEVIRTFCQQVLAKLVIEMTIQSCSKPEFINGWIVYLLEEGETELMKDIDAGLEGLNAATPKTAAIIAPEPGSSTHTRADTAQREHKRVKSRVQDAMDEAMQEAQRLSRLIAEEDARRLRETAASSSEETTKEPVLEHLIKEDPFTDSKRTASSSSILTDASESTTQGVPTPTSSHSDGHAQDEPRQSQDQAIDERFGSQLEPVESAPFTSFAQLEPRKSVTALSDAQKVKKEIPPLTLHNATISIFDDTDPSDRSSLRQKPITDYLIQIEPPSAHYPGWMIVRKYADFENLHEVLRRIAAISGAGVFTQAHSALPGWKNHTKASLREALERYLTDAVRFQSLAESEGMKRFLEKERGMEKSPNTKDGGFGWPTPTSFENMGKGMMDVLTKAPKGVAGGGKAFIGGVSGVLGKKKAPSVSPSPAVSRSSTSLPRDLNQLESNVSQSSLPRQSQDSSRNMSPIVDTQPALVPLMERKPSIPADTELPRRPSSKPGSKASSIRGSMDMMPILGGDQILHLPPPPSDIADDYSFVPEAIKNRTNTQISEAEPTVRTSTTTAPSPIAERSSSEGAPEKVPELPTRPSRQASAKPPITEQETQMTVELLFAIINELYTLSNAWGLRRTLLTAAKTFLLRPGNPQLESIRQLLQTTVLDANTSDAGIAMHLRKLRENALPTEEELKAWPAELTKDEREELRRKARKLLVERGMPQALTSVMGQAASGEALGKVFDCLQVQKVARGLVFGLMLQGLRAVTQ